MSELIQVTEFSLFRYFVHDSYG